MTTLGSGTLGSGTLGNPGGAVVVVPQPPPPPELVWGAPDPWSLTAARLVDGARELVLLPTPPTRRLYLRTLEVGEAAVRDDARPRPDDDGSDDHTRLHGPRPVTYTGVLSDMAAFDEVNELARFCAPARRPWLYYTRHGQAERRIRLRHASASAPLAAPERSALSVAAQWIAPEGVAETVQRSSVTLQPETPAAAGLTFPLTFPLLFTGGGTPGAALARPAGTAPAHWRARVDGPVTGPRVEITADGDLLARIELPGLEIPTGSYLAIDSRARTVLAEDNAGASRASSLDFATLRWGRLEPGADNLVRFYPAVYSPPAALTLEWADTWGAFA